MTASSPIQRQQRFAQLCHEIDDLVARYAALPPGRPQSICQSEIDKRLREIDDLNAEQHAQGSRTPAPAAASAPSGRPATKYPGVGIAAILIIVGVIIPSYVMVTVGSILMLFSLGIPYTNGADRPTSPPPEPERFQWRP